MADEEHFSLCWNNFTSNLSTGFHESLCRGDLVDVTLVAEGRMVKAHRLVLSVCSPLFRDMFAAMQPNQQAFVVLPNITHMALQDLMTFIYCGEVNIKNEALSTFISTAESLQIKGLTDSETPTKSEVIAPQIITVDAPTVTAPTRVAARPAPKRSSGRAQQLVVEKHESEDSSAEDVQSVVVTAQPVAPPKRMAPVKTVVNAKRLKISAASTPTATPTKTPAPTITTSAAAKRQAALSVKTEEVLIELPIEEDPIAADPEEVTEQEDAQQEILEDDSYATMKYDDSYFTENDTTTENKSTTSSYQVDQTTGDITQTDTQDLIGSDAQMFIISRKGGSHLVHNKYVYRSNLKRQGKNKDIIYWECVRNREIKCRARLKSVGDNLYLANMNTDHNHISDSEKIRQAKKKNMVTWKNFNELGQSDSA